MSAMDHISGLEMTAENQLYLEEVNKITLNNVALFQRNVASVKRRIGFLTRYYELDVSANKLSVDGLRLSQEDLMDLENIHSGLQDLVVGFDKLLESVEEVDGEMAFCALVGRFDCLYEALIEYENWLMKFRIKSEEIEESEELEEYEKYSERPKNQQ